MTGRTCNRIFVGQWPCGRLRPTLQPESMRRLGLKRVQTLKSHKSNIIPFKSQWKCFRSVIESTRILFSLLEIISCAVQKPSCYFKNIYVISVIIVTGLWKRNLPIHSYQPRVKSSVKDEIFSKSPFRENYNKRCILPMILFLLQHLVSGNDKENE
jgi:hypothetical protein